MYYSKSEDVIQTKELVNMTLDDVKQKLTKTIKGKAEAEQGVRYLFEGKQKGEVFSPKSIRLSPEAMGRLRAIGTELGTMKSDEKGKTGMSETVEALSIIAPLLIEAVKVSGSLDGIPWDLATTAMDQKTAEVVYKAIDAIDKHTK